MYVCNTTLLGTEENKKKDEKNPDKLNARVKCVRTLIKFSEARPKRPSCDESTLHTLVVFLKI